MINHWGAAILQAVPQLVFNPFTYLLLAFLLLVRRRQRLVERRLFATKLMQGRREVFYFFATGVGAGLLLSCFLLALGVMLPFEAMAGLWLLALLLIHFGLRWFSFSYAAALLALFSIIIQALPTPSAPLLAQLWHQLMTLSLPALFTLVALIHLAEAILLYMSRHRPPTPILVRSKRGRIVGGYELHYFWFAPLFLFTESGQASLELPFAWWPLFAQESVFTWGLMLMPAVLGYADRAVTESPHQKLSRAARWLLLHGLILLGISLAAVFIPWLIWLSLSAAALGPTGLLLYSRNREKKGAPLYVHPKQGLKILAVAPHSPAEKMGLEPGEVILKVNGITVEDSDALYHALARNKAFCKMELINVDGELKFAQSAIYEQDHHQLGLILAPDERVLQYLDNREVRLFSLLRPRFVKRPSAHSEEEHDSSKEKHVQKAL